MSVTKRVFDTDKKTGKTVYEYTLENANGMKAIAAIPSRDVLISKLLGSLQSPITSRSA